MDNAFNDMKKLIIVPAYNESESIERVIAHLNETAPEYDYVIINDCSTDNTSAIAKNAGAHVIDLPVNLGIGGCVQTGYKYALENDYDIAVQMDGDGQHDAAYLNTLFEYMQRENADMVIGSRFIDKKGFQSSAARRIGIKIISLAIKITTGVKITDPTSGFRMINRKVIAMFAKSYPVDYPESETNASVIRCNLKVCEAPVEMRERMGGVSSISVKKALYFMPKVVLAILIDKLK